MKNISFSPNDINTSSRKKITRINTIIIKEKVLWSFIKFSRLILQENVWRSVWKFCKWICIGWGAWKVATRSLHIWLHRLLNRKRLGAIETLLWYTSIQGTQNLVTEKCSHNVCICYHTSIQGNWTIFWVLKFKFNFHSGDTLALKTWLTTKRVDKLSVHSLCHTSRRTALARIQYHRDKLPWLFGHYLAACNNDCNRFQGRIKQILLVYY